MDPKSPNDHQEPRVEGMIAKSERARAVARARASGMTWKQIAKTFGITDRHARRLAKQVVEGGDPRVQAEVGADIANQRAQVLAPAIDDPFRPADPLGPIQRMLDALEWAGAEMRKEAASATPSAARVRALRGYSDLEWERLRLLVQVGAVPNAPFMVLRAEGAGHFMRRVLDVLHSDGVDRDAIARAMHAVQEHGAWEPNAKVPARRAHTQQEAERAAA